MKKYMTTMLMILALGLPLTAQGDEKQKECKPGQECKVHNGQHKFNPEKMLEWRTAQLAGKLMLSDEEKAKFVPLYKEYVGEMAKLIAPQKQAQPGKRYQDMTDAELDQMMKAKFKKQADINKMRETYYDKFRKFLTAKQAATVIKANGHPGMKKPNFRKFHQGRQVGMHSGKGMKPQRFQRHPMPEDGQPAENK